MKHGLPHYYGLALILGAHSSGCYMAHGRADDADRDGSFVSAPDAGLGPRPPERSDAGFDGAVVLPPTVDGGRLADDEPDVRPGERPSDDPASAIWRDPPAPVAGDCCEVGEVVALDDPGRQASVPVVAWTGARWGVAFSDAAGPPTWGGPWMRTLFRRVDATGHPAGALQVLDDFLVRPTDLAWGNHRYALLTKGLVGGTGPALLSILDETGAPRSVTSIAESRGGAALARHPLIHGWAVATYLDDDTGGVSGRSHLLLFDDSLARLPVERDLGRTLSALWRSLSVVSLRSRLAVAQATDAGILLRAFDGAGLEEDERVRATVWPGTYLVNRGPREHPLEDQVASAVSATRLRDSVVVAFMNRTQLSTFVVDPFGELPPTETVAVARSSAHTNPGMGGDDVTGTVGICFPDGASPIGGPATVNPDELRFAAVDPDGQPVGDPVTVASGLHYAATCDVAAGGPGEWFVIWWNADEPERRHAIFGARITLRAH